MDVDEYMENEEWIKQVFEKYVGGAGYTWHLNYDLPRLEFKIDVWGQPWFNVVELRNYINILQQMDEELNERKWRVIVREITITDGVVGEIDRL